MIFRVSKDISPTSKPRAAMSFSRVDRNASKIHRYIIQPLLLVYKDKMKGGQSLHCLCWFTAEHFLQDTSFPPPYVPGSQSLPSFSHIQSIFPNIPYLVGDTALLVSWEKSLTPVCRRPAGPQTSARTLGLDLSSSLPHWVLTSVQPTWLGLDSSGLYLPLFVIWHSRPASSKSIKSKTVCNSYVHLLQPAVCTR